ncbi:MAG: hypothetical protein L3J29_12020 [Cyclobacteriaceae bacterium]|nr:hypothetical protein [Cyclobacteriaceae bacterium]
MKIPTFRIIGILILMGGAQFLKAQPTQGDIDNYVVGLTSDFNQYMNFYITPALKGLGYGFNNGWYNTARPHKSFGFDLTISANAAYVPTIDQSFTFVPDNYQVLDLTDDPSLDDNFPTLMGGTTTNEVRSYLIKGDPQSPFIEGPILDGILEDLPINASAVPSPIIQLGVGIYKKTEVKVRWVPTIQNSGGLEYQYFGLGVMHSISQWIPVMKNVKFLDVSGFVGFTNIDLTYKLDSDPDLNPLDNQVANFGVNTITYEVVGSATFSVFTGFVGIGFDNFKTNLNLNGDYYIRIPGVADRLAIKDPVALNVDGSGFRATAGVRLKLAIFTLHGAYTLQEYNTLNVGFGFSFR